MLFSSCWVCIHFLYSFFLSQILYSFSIFNSFYVDTNFLIYFFFSSLFNYKFNTNFEFFFFFYKNATIFIFNEYENGKKVYSFFIFKITFLEIENENWVQITKLNQFFNSESHWKLKMKTKYTVFFPTCFLLYLKSLKRVALEKLHSFIWNLKENILKWCSSKNLDFPRRINIMGQIEDANKLHHLFESTLAQ